MEQKIKDALAKLDVNNDNHWTADGNARIETMRMLTGTPSLTREDITKVDQEFNRDNARKAIDKKVDDDKRVAGELSKSENVDAQGNPTGVPSAGMPGGLAVAGATADSAAPGELIGPDGGTANPTADSDNQLGDAELGQAHADEALLDQQAELKEQIAAGEDYLAQLVAQRDALGPQIDTVNQQLDTLKSKLGNDEPDHRTNMASIQGYLRMSQEQREARAGLAREDGAGVKHVPKQHKAPVDQALQGRRRTPGNGT